MFPVSLRLSEAVVDTYRLFFSPRADWIRWKVLYILLGKQQGDTESCRLGRVHWLKAAFSAEKM